MRRFSGCDSKTLTPRGECLGELMNCQKINKFPPPTDKTGWPWTDKITPMPATMSDGTPWPKISIVTPSYNQGHFIEETIRSVLLQDYPNLEYIIIDGDSCDNSVEIIKKYSKHISYWVSEPDRGQAHAINKGISWAHGDIMAWLNSDDIYLPKCFDKVTEAFRQHPEADVVYGDHIFIDSEGKEILRKREIPVDFKIMLFGRNHVAQPTVFWRRGVLERVGLLDETLHYALDWEWWFRMGKAGCRFYKIRDFLAATRWQNNSKSVLDQKKFLRERRALQTAYLGSRIKPQYKCAIPVCLFVLDLIYRMKWHLKKLITLGTFDVIEGRRKLRRKRPQST